MRLTLNMPSSSKDETIAFISVTYPVGSECTCENESKKLYATDTSGSFIFKIPTTGSWIISCSKTGEGTVTKSVLVDQYVTYFVRLSYDTFDKLKTDAAATTAPILFSENKNDFIRWGNTYNLTRTTDTEKVLFIISDANQNNASNIRRGAIISPTNDLSLSKSGTENGPIEMIINGHTLYIYWGGNTTVNFDLLLHTSSKEKSFLVNDMSNTVLAWLQLSTRTIQCTDSDGGRQQKAQLEDILTRFVYLIEEEEPGS